ncbi:MFS general substrate transporter [Pseudovirgaria hyperparasitica]|uniref:MFS general substrate transporter n=1 Tax=Pseudovirgaria hyperparasitica TaxID=470096 RepID=A0A6A6WC61_9PEZI|nr:MFS general substrate transporter [Pseudovirgaria hyperparasitica]KAF2758701.1 MFS general substrate transporter [Pseudovirgaria hyperparasitica]
MSTEYNSSNADYEPLRETQSHRQRVSSHLNRNIRHNVEKDRGVDTSWRKRVSAMNQPVPQRNSSMINGPTKKSRATWLDGRTSSPDQLPPSRTAARYVSDVSTNSSSNVMVAYEPADRSRLIHQMPAQRPTTASMSRTNPASIKRTPQKIVHPPLRTPLGTRDQKKNPNAGRKPSKVQHPRDTHVDQHRASSVYSNDLSPAPTVIIAPHPPCDRQPQNSPPPRDDQSNLSSPPSWKSAPDALDAPDALSLPSVPDPYQANLPKSPGGRFHEAINDRGDLIREAMDMAESAIRSDRPEEVESLLNQAIEEVRHEERRPSRTGLPTRQPTRGDRMYDPETGYGSNGSSSSSMSFHAEINENHHGDNDIELQPLVRGQPQGEGSPQTPRTRRQCSKPVAVDWADLLGNNRRSSESAIKSFLTRSGTKPPSSPGAIRKPSHDQFGHLIRSSTQIQPTTQSNQNTGFTEASIPSLRHPHRRHISFRKTGGSSFYRQSTKDPLARNWSGSKKRLTAAVACVNTGLMGLIIGLYAGEVPRIQYQLADEQHVVILGNMYFYLGLAITTFIAWPLPLLHGRKIYTLIAIAVAMPLQFPQAIITSQPRSPLTIYRFGVMFPRILTGLAMGLANINQVTTLMDLFGASLQSKSPHQEIAFTNDVRRHGGGLGLWLGIWCCCFTASIAIGFMTGAGLIAHDLNPSWSFTITIMMLAFVLLLNLLTPETRKSRWRHSYAEFVDEKDQLHRRVARGEVKLHISTEGPKYWYEETLAGLTLNLRMIKQPGFLVMAFYLGWMYAQIVLVMVLLGALLSRDYQWRADKVGAGVFSLAIGALLAIPLARAGKFSRARKRGPRTDSMTIAAKVTWTSHMVRRIIFMTTLPLTGIAYTLASGGSHISWTVPVIFAGAIGFLSNLAIAECYGMIMETFDTSDLQPGINSRHRLQSLAADVKQRRTNYSSFPRVTAGIFVSQSIGFLFAAVATAVGGVMTRRWGAQISTGITAGILFILTVLLMLVLTRFREVQVVPNSAFHTWRQSFAAGMTDADWKPVVLGNPSGKMRRISVLEMGVLSRWSEIRRLNKLME